MDVFDDALVGVGDGDAVFVSERAAVGCGVSVKAGSNVKVLVGCKDVDVSLGDAVAGELQADNNTTRTKIAENVLFDSIKTLLLFMATLDIHFVQ